MTVDGFAVHWQLGFAGLPAPGSLTAVALPLAHHMMVAALPFFGPMLVIVVVLTVMAVKDRRKHRKS